MQKSTFVESMTLIQAMLFGIGSSVSGLQEEDQEIKAKLFPLVEDSYDLVGKTLKAFFASNEKSSFSHSKLSDVIAVKGGAASPAFEQLKPNLVAFVRDLLKELEKHSGAVVHHDSGKVWKKTKTDKTRFEKIVSNMAEISELI